MKSKAKNIVIGAGASGMMAANDLLSKGEEVVILEAADRVGGRICTIRNHGFETAVEKGFEFIHGNLPITIKLLKKAGINYEPVGGRMFRIENHELKKQTEFAEDWDELMEKMNEVKEDISFQEFLLKNFSDEKYHALRETATRFAAGFDLAEPGRASTLALRTEWMEEEDEQFRIPGGADQLMNFLLKEIKNKGGEIYLSAEVSKIVWEKNHITVTTKSGQTITTEKILLTVSLGVLQAEPSLIQFEPVIESYFIAAKKMGFGSVVKLLLQFRENFWEEKKNNLGFLFSGQKIPTWWTQLPRKENLLTGWAGGPQAKDLEDLTDDAILQIGLQSLSKIFDISVSDLRQKLMSSAVANWKKDRFTRGAYSFSTLESVQARKLLATPIDNTIFFGGEGLYEGNSPGTLEAALVSGKEAAARMLGITD